MGRSKLEELESPWCTISCSLLLGCNPICSAPMALNPSGQQEKVHTPTISASPVMPAYDSKETPQYHNSLLLLSRHTSAQEQNQIWKENVCLFYLIKRMSQRCMCSFRTSYCHLSHSVSGLIWKWLGKTFSSVGMCNSFCLLHIFPTSNQISSVICQRRTKQFADSVINLWPHPRLHCPLQFMSDCFFYPGTELE